MCFGKLITLSFGEICGFADGSTPPGYYMQLKELPEVGPRQRGDCAGKEVKELK